MPRDQHVPRYLLHKASGQARVVIDGRTFYLGPWKSKASRLEYDRIINEWLAGGRSLDGPQAEPLTVVEILARYRRHAQRYYRKNGRSTGEAEGIDDAIAYLRDFYGRTPAAEFGPRRLKAIRQAMIENELSRQYINKQVGRIRRVFRWAASEELVPATVPQALATVDGLRAGRSEAREAPRVEAVDASIVDQTLPYLSDTVADMVRFQRLTGCRPAEVCTLRPAAVDRATNPWRYTVAGHKTEHRGKPRVVFVGPQAQAVLRPYLLREGESYCFSPAEAEQKRRALRSEQRATPESCGNTPGSNRQAQPRRTAGLRYTTASYRRAVHRAIAAANEQREQDEQQLPKWSPNQLRHSAASQIRASYGLEAAQVVLGHAKVDATQIYAEANEKLAARIMQEIG